MSNHQSDIVDPGDTVFLAIHRRVESEINRSLESEIGRSLVTKVELMGMISVLINELRRMRTRLDHLEAAP